MLSRQDQTHPCTWGIAILVVCCLVVPSQAESIDPVRLAKIQFSYLYNFAKFITWPDESFVNNDGDFVITIVGEPRFQQAVAGLENKSIASRSLSINTLTSEDMLSFLQSPSAQSARHREIVTSLRNSQIVFVDRIFAEHWAAVVEQLDGSPVLTVGDIAGFARDGGMIELFLDERKVAFDINIDVASTCGLTISSKLLRLADDVVSEQ